MISLVFRRHLFVVLLAFIPFLRVNTSAASDADARYVAAGKAYEQKDFDAAIAGYEGLLQEGYRSPALEYNLGNAHFKAGHLAQSILHYERALKAAPDDEDARYNLRIANLQVVDKIEAIPPVFYRRWMNNLADLLNPDAWSWSLVILSWLLASTVFGFLIIGSPALKKLFFLSSLVLLLLAVSALLAGRESHRKATLDHEAVILSPSLYVKSAPDEKGNDLFILHEGTKVGLLDAVGDWQEIRIANGTVGWVKRNTLEAI